jgi:hypothetical protein
MKSSNIEGKMKMAEQSAGKSAKGRKIGRQRKKGKNARYIARYARCDDVKGARIKRRVQKSRWSAETLATMFPGYDFSKVDGKVYVTRKRSAKG